jgi:nonsense-mediated mRNA decay protein 3
MGDFVKYNKAITQVTGYDGNKIYLVDLSSSERVSIPWKSVGKLEVVARNDEIKKVMISARTPRSVQILHPDTYQPVDIDLHEESPHITIGKEIEVVEINNVFYLLG